MREEKNSPIFLRPRFKLDLEINQQRLLQNFKKKLKDANCTYKIKIVDNHVVIDVPVDEAHFWSPQLNLEVIKVTDLKSVVKGLFGPKPQVWTLFMFVHFVAAFAFIAFAIMAYVKWTLNADYSFPMFFVIGLPILWVLLYVLGSLGKKTGNQQMEAMRHFLLKTLNEAAS